MTLTAPSLLGSHDWRPLAVGVGPVLTAGLDGPAQRSPFTCKELPSDEEPPRGQQAEASSGKGEPAVLGARQGTVAEWAASVSRRPSDEFRFPENTLRLDSCLSATCCPSLAGPTDDGVPQT